MDNRGLDMLALRMLKPSRLVLVSMCDSESMLWMASVCGEIKPELTVRLCLCRKECRLRLKAWPRFRSSSPMVALGDIFADGCGRVVFRSAQVSDNQSE